LPAPLFAQPGEEPMAADFGPLPAIDTPAATAILEAAEGVPVTLGEALAIAMEANEGLRAHRALIEAAEGGLRAARASYWFSLDATYRGRQTNTFPDPDLSQIPGGEDIAGSFSQEDWINTLEFALVQPLPVFGTQRLIVRAADLELGRQEAVFVEQAQELRQRVVSAFYRAQLAQRALEVREAEVDRNETNLGLARSRFEAGVSPRFDVTRAEVQLLNARDSLIQARRGAALALLAFQDLLGGEEAYVPGATETAEASVPVLPREWDPMAVTDAVALAQRNRPEILQLRLAEDLRSTELSLTKRRPSLGLAGTLNYSDQESSFTGANSTTIALQMTIPLWDGGRDRGEIQQGEAEQEAIRINLEAAEQGIALEVQDAVMALQEAAARLETARRTEEQAAEALQMAQAGFDEGVLIYLDLLTAQHELTAAQLNRLNAATDLAVAEAELVRALGFLDPAQAAAALVALEGSPLKRGVGEGEVAQ
ncbi:MAG TPA: TolC family protein, partial [bacterium]|nr:TolC family protein [bacterium]